MYKILVNIKAVLKIPSEPGSGEERLEGKWVLLVTEKIRFCVCWQKVIGSNMRLPRKRPGLHN